MLTELIVGGLVGGFLGLSLLYIIEKETSRQQSKQKPCEPDHNGECLICDCWLSDCAYDRYEKKDYTFETKEQLEEMFKNQKQ